MIRFNGMNFGSIFGYGSGNSLYSNLSQLSSVRSGAYSKALKAYYGKNNSTAATKATQKNHSANKYNYSAYAANSGLSDVSKESTELVAAAKKLTDTGKDGLFASKENYDADKAYKAVNEFVSNYNETLDAVNKTTNTAVNNAANSMARMAGAMMGSLSKVGITVEKDGRMSLNEEEFKNAGFEKVKSLVGKDGSFSGIISSSAQRLGSAAEQQSRQTMGNAGIYGRYGSYFGNYNFGSRFDSWF